VIGYIPSPPANGVHLGPFELHFYGLLIAIAVLVAAWLVQRRWARLGGLPATIVPIAFWAVVGGLIGARLYSVVTSWQQDTSGDWVQIFEIWNGGLGIWGAVSGGVIAGWLKARRMHIPLPPLLDVVAPALPLAQAIGRWGNYFNQELFGLPSKLPWAVRITNQVQLSNLAPKYRPPFVDGRFLARTFQPTFLYECIWDLVTFGLLLLIERKVKLRRGYLFAAYASLYTFGRFFTEYLRIDPAHRYLGLRLNDWTSVGVFVIASAVLVLKGRPPRSRAPVGHFADSGPVDLVGDPLRESVRATERARLGLPSETGSDQQVAGGPVAVAGGGPEVAAGDESAPGGVAVSGELAVVPEAEATGEAEATSGAETTSGAEAMGESAHTGEAETADEAEANGEAKPTSEAAQGLEASGDGGGDAIGVDDGLAPDESADGRDSVDEASALGTEVAETAIAVTVIADGAQDQDSQSSSRAGLPASASEALPLGATEPGPALGTTEAGQPVEEDEIALLDEGVSPGLEQLEEPAEAKADGPSWP
jgi:prolipoprotein diacylglyceryl transferase